MLYGEHRRFFDREIERLGQPPFDLSIRSFLEVLGRAGSEEADAACRVFAATLEWPRVPEHVRMELCLRLACARWWCTEVEGLETEDEVGKAFLESILIGYWRDVGRVDWLWENYCLTPAEKEDLKKQQRS